LRKIKSINIFDIDKEEINSDNEYIHAQNYPDAKENTDFYKNENFKKVENNFLKPLIPSLDLKMIPKCQNE
jgi:hypothetical protein